MRPSNPVYAQGGLPTFMSTMNALLYLGAASIVFVIALSAEFQGGVERDVGEAAYAFVVACLTILIVCVYTIAKYCVVTSRGRTEVPVLVFLAINWVVAASAVTFGGPFFDTGNGYFAAWASAILSVHAAADARTRR